MMRIDLPSSRDGIDFPIGLCQRRISLGLYPMVPLIDPVASRRGPPAPGLSRVPADGTRRGWGLNLRTGAWLTSGICALPWDATTGMCHRPAVSCEAARAPELSWPSR